MNPQPEDVLGSKVQLTRQNDNLTANFEPIV
jgi:hypothetical protein